MILDLHMKRVEAGCERSRLEAQNIVVWRLIGDGDQTRLQVFGIVKMKELAPRELRDRFGGFCAQGIPRGKKGHGRKPKRRSQHANAVEHLTAVVSFVLCRGSIAAEATVRGTGLVRAVKLGCLETDPFIYTNIRLFVCEGQQTDSS